MKKKLAAFSAALLLILGASGCDFEPISQENNYTQPSSTGQPIPVETQGHHDTDSSVEPTTEPPTEPPIQDSTVHFLAVGDNLVQKRVYESAQKHAAEGEKYNFNYCYKNVADKVAAADLAFINQETIIAGDKYEISGSNFNFNSPTQLGDEMVDLGFDIICMSNNHALDKGTGGLNAALDYWDTKTSQTPTLKVIGCYRDAQDMENYRISEVNGMTIGYLAYTEHINGYSLPSDSAMKIPLTSQTTLIEQQIKELDGMVDAVVVSAHWGAEDTHTVSDSVRSLAKNMVEWGADVIIGTHSHTLETMEYVTRTDGTQGFVFYSLGNFISAQTDSFNMVGGMAEFDLKQSGDQLTVENVQVTPVITHYDDGSLTNLRLYPYYMYTDELVAGHGLPYSPWGTAKKWSWNVIDTIVSNNVPEEFRKLTQ